MDKKIFNISNKKLIIFIVILFCLSMIITAATSAYVFWATRTAPTEFAPVTPTSGAGTGYYRHCYEELLDDEKQMYSVILSGIYSMPEKIEVPSLNGGNFSKVFSALSYDNPDLFCLSTSGSLQEIDKKLYFVPEYNMSFDEYKNKLGQANSIAKAIATSAVSYTSDYEKELYIHDYIVNHCTYDTSKDNMNDIYGCLVNGRASCEGYSRAFQYILSAVSIDNRLVTGMGENAAGKYEGHMWNYVVIEDEGYFTDITWDDPSADGSILRHTYFNNTTADMLKKHNEIAETLPLCTSTTYNYYIYEGCCVNGTNEETFKDELKNIVLNARNRGYRCAEICFDSEETLNWAVDVMFKKNIVFDVYNDAGIVISDVSKGIYYSTDKDYFTVCLYF